MSTSSLWKEEEGLRKSMSGQQLFNIIFDVLRVGGDDGAVVVVVGIRIFDALIGDAQVEDEFPAPVSAAIPHVRGPAWPGSTRIHWGWIRCPSRRSFRLDSGERITRKPSLVKRIPERIVLVHIENSGIPTVPGRFLLRERIIGKQPFIL